MYCKCTSHLGLALELKRNRYALYGVPEYWLADLDTRTILVLILVLAMSGGEYVERGALRHWRRTATPLIPDLRIPEAQVFVGI